MAELGEWVEFVPPRRTFVDAHAAVAVGIAERYLEQPRDMTWEDRCDELATAAIVAMQLYIANCSDAPARARE